MGRSHSVERIDAEDQASALELALNLLRPGDRGILTLVYFEGLSIEAAGARRGLERSVANTRLVRARLRLGEKLATWRDVIRG